MEEELIRYAVKLFPITDYLPVRSVRHNRREWVKSVMFLRGCRPSKWILDNQIEPMLNFPDLDF